MRSQAARYVKQYAGGGGACFQVQSVLAKLSLCRTRALGGKTYRCDDCGETTEVYHSCSDRHCPQCSGCRRYDFAERAEQLILPGMTYYQVVFTLPSELSEIALANREPLADLLFGSAAQALRKTIRTQQGYDPASMMVLHTWNQQLQSHWHVHALVPGAGPSLTGNRWQTARAPVDAPESRAVNSDGFYLVDAISLRTAFRKSAMAKLKQLYKTGQLKLEGKYAHLQGLDQWTVFCGDLNGREWVSFIQPPPTRSNTADQVVRYLTRYLTGGPISDQRIVSADMNQVTFMAREGKRTGGDREQVPVTLETIEFTRRWCQHIQSDQLTKTRYFGGWCSRKRTQYQQRCRELFAETQQTEALPISESSIGESSIKAAPESTERVVKCQACASAHLRFVGMTAKPTWGQLLTHLDERCPQWYAESEYRTFCEYLEREYWIGYEDWCLELRIESPMRRTQSSVPRAMTKSHQPYLPGFTPERDFALESY